MGGNQNYIKNGTAGIDTYEGTHSVSLSNPIGNETRWYSTIDVSVQAGDTVIFSAYIKTENMLGDAWAGIRADVNNNGAFAGAVMMTTINGDNDWTLVSATWVVTEGITGFQPMVMMGVGSDSANGVGAIAYFDNVSVTVIPVPEPASFALLSLAAGGLMLRRR